MTTTENRHKGENTEIPPDSARFALHPLHEAALRIADLGIGRRKDKTRDLIGLLLSHGARAWRHSQPPARIHLHVAAAGRRFPVILRMR